MSVDQWLENLSYEKASAAMTPAAVHKIAEKMGIRWDSSKPFMDTCEELTGKRHLDSMNPGELGRVAAAIRSGAFEKTAERLRRRVNVLITNDKGEVLVQHHPVYSYGFPGGGIEKGQSINQAARREALEEVGLRVSKLRGLGVRPKKIVWDDHIKSLLTKNKRGARFDGSIDYWRTAKAGEKDLSLYGDDNDILEDARFVSIQDVIKDIKETKKNSDYEWAGGDPMKITALESLQARLNKTAGMPFLKQNRPAKVKEIYRALKRDHPNMDEGKKARIASATYNKMKAASEYREGGQFTHDGALYDLNKALRRGSREPVVDLPVSSLRWVLRHDTPDPSRVRRADLNAPVLVAEDRRGRLTVIDGLHRLAKADREGLSTIPAKKISRRDLAFAKTAEIHLITGGTGAGKSTEARRRAPQYDEVFSTDIGKVVGGRYVMPKDKVKARADKEEKILDLHRQGKKILVEGYPKGLSRFTRVVASADRLEVMGTPKPVRVFRVLKRHKEQGRKFLSQEKGRVFVPFSETGWRPEKEDRVAMEVIRQINPDLPITKVANYNLRKGLVEELKEIQKALKEVRDKPMTKEHWKAYSRHSALNAGMVARALRYFTDHPDASTKSESAKRRLTQLLNAVAFTAMPPTHHHPGELAQMAKGVGKHRDYFKRGYAPWKYPSPEKTAGHKLYHGSPHRLDHLEPRRAREKGGYSDVEAVHFADSPEEAALYALMRPRKGKRGRWAVVKGKVHYAKGDPLNRQGYVYEYEGEAEPPPADDRNRGYRVKGRVKPSSRKRVRMKGREEFFVEYPDKDAYKAFLKQHLEKNSSQRLYHGSPKPGIEVLRVQTSQHTHVPEEMKKRAQADGHWRTLKPHQEGHDASGNLVMGKTWVTKGRLDPSVKLKPHQQDFVKAVIKSKRGRGIIAGHGTGTGKTVSGIAAFEELKEKGRAKRALVVVPAGLRDNFLNKGVNRFTDSNGVILKQPQAVSPDVEYVVVSYSAFRKRPREWMAATGADTIIADEFHRAGNPDSSTYQALQAVRPQTKNFIGLTASITQNTPADVVPLVNLAAGEEVWRDKKQFSKRYIKKSPSQTKGIFGGKKYEKRLVRKQEILEGIGPTVHYVEDLDATEKPRKNVKHVEVPMSREQLAIYRRAMRGIDPTIAARIAAGERLSKRERGSVFEKLIWARKVSNSIHGAIPGVSLAESAQRTPKIRAVLDEAQQHLSRHPDAQIIMYTNVVKGGVDVLQAGLKARNIPYGTFAGKSVKGITEKGRQQDVDDYLEGKKKVIIITGAGAEGLSLGNTTMVQVVDGHYNPERISQAEARGIRAGGLAHRAPKERKVDVRRYVSSIPKSIFQRITFREPDRSVDQWVYQTAQGKGELNREMRDILQARAEFERKRRQSLLYRVAVRTPKLDE